MAVVGTSLVATATTLATGEPASQQRALAVTCPAGTEMLPATDGLGPVACAPIEPAPPGVDVTGPVPTRELLARDGAADAAIEATEAAGVPTPVDVAAAGDRAVTCDGDGATGYRVQAIYAYDPAKPPKSVGGDRYTDTKAKIQQWAAGVDTVFNRSAALTGGYRKVRWVTEADGAGGCVVSVLKVPMPASVLTSSGLAATRTFLTDSGYTAPNRKYLVWADATVLCGIASTYNAGSAGGRYSTPTQTNFNNGYYASYGRVDTACWGNAASTEAHEIMHMLGGVLDNAPHASAAGHCTDESDRMCYVDGSGITMTDVCPPDQETLLDCNGDDYFSTNPAAGSWLAGNWNTADSRFLLGGGNGTVSGSAGTNRVDLFTNTAPAGLPSQVTATVTKPAGRTHTTAWAVRTAGCVLTDTTTDQTNVRCVPSVTAAAVTATVTDSAGVTSIASRLLAPERAPRPATVTVTSANQATVSVCLPAAVPLTAVVTDTATGTGVYGAGVQFLSGGDVIGSATTDLSGLAAVTATVKTAGPVTARVVDATYAAATVAGQVTVAHVCPVTYTTTTVWQSAPARVVYGTAPTVSGTLTVRASNGATVAPTGARVRVVATPTGLAPITVYAPVAANGTWSVKLSALTRVTTATATFDAGPWPASSAGTRTVVVDNYQAAPAITAATTKLSGAGTVTVSGVAYKVYGTTKVTLPGARVSVVHYDPAGKARTVGTVTADASGRFTVRGTVYYTGTLRATVAAAAGVSAGSTSARTITVTARPSIGVSATASYNKYVTVTGATNPARSSYTMYLQRYANKRWTTVATVRSDAAGKARVNVRQNVRGTVYYRWYVPGDRYQLAGYSAQAKVTVR